MNSLGAFEERLERIATSKGQADSFAVEAMGSLGGAVAGCEAWTVGDTFVTSVRVLGGQASYFAALASLFAFPSLLGIPGLLLSLAAVPAASVFYVGGARDSLDPDLDEVSLHGVWARYGDRYWDAAGLYVRLFGEYLAVSFKSCLYYIVSACVLGVGAAVLSKAGEVGIMVALCFGPIALGWALWKALNLYRVFFQRWAFAHQFVVLERCGSQAALDRSQAIAEVDEFGVFARLMGLFFVVGLATVPTSSLVAFLWSTAGMSADPWMGRFLLQVVGGVSGAWLWIAWTCEALSAEARAELV